MFDWSMSSSLARTFSPRVLESQIDAKKVFTIFVIVNYFLCKLGRFHSSLNLWISEVNDKMTIYIYYNHNIEAILPTLGCLAEGLISIPPVFSNFIGQPRWLELARA